MFLVKDTKRWSHKKKNQTEINEQNEKSTSIHSRAGEPEKMENLGERHTRTTFSHTFRHQHTFECV